MRKAKLSREQMYQVVRAPVVTEKSTLNSESGQVTFLVDRCATKAEVAASVEGLFGVEVEAVNTLRQEGKRKRFRGRIGRRASYKKAMVRLAKGNSIDVTSGI